MAHWSALNLKGKILAVACCFNLWVAFVIAMKGDWSCVVSFVVAMFCGLSTYNKRYQHIDANEINETKK